MHLSAARPLSTTRRRVIIGPKRLPPGLLCSGKHGRSVLLCAARLPFRGPARLSAAPLVSPRPRSSLRGRLAFSRPGSPFRSPARLSAAGSLFRGPARLSAVGLAFPQPCSLSTAPLAFPRPDRLSTAGSPLHGPVVGYYQAEASPARSFMFRQTRAIGVCFAQLGCLSAARRASPQSCSLFHGPARLSTARLVSPRPGTSLRGLRLSAARHVSPRPAVTNCRPGSRAEVRNGGSRRPARSPGASDSRR